MQNYNCIIVEDEPLAAEVLQDYIRQTPFLELKATCTDAISAMEVLNREPVDLIFLDIHLPRLKGLDFLKSLRHPPFVIITSAYHEYALQGYEFNVVDFLLKPIEFTRYLMAVNKLGHRETVTHTVSAEPQHIFLSVDKKKIRILLADVVIIEGMKEYIRIITPKRRYVTKFSIGQMEQLLPASRFLRIHRSFIVSLDNIEAYTATEVEIAGQSLPIGRNYKDAVLAVLARTTH